MSDAAASDPLAPEQKAQLAQARVAHRALTRPARVAAFNGWTVGIFGAATVAWGALAGGSGVLVGGVLVAVAWNELRGSRRVKALDPQGATILAWNQILLALVIAGYCLWVIRGSTPDPATLELEEAAGIPAELVRDLTRWMYGGIAVVVVVVQGILARWYFAVRGRIAAFRGSVPIWVLEWLG